MKQNPMFVGETISRLRDTFLSKFYFFPMLIKLKILYDYTYEKIINNTNIPHAFQLFFRIFSFITINNYFVLLQRNYNNNNEKK
jgi:hypothetical protein